MDRENNFVRGIPDFQEARHGRRVHTSNARLKDYDHSRNTSEPKCHPNSRDLPTGKEERHRLARFSSRYTIYQGSLYTRGFLTRLLKYIGLERVEYMMKEIHEGSCDHHLGDTFPGRKILWANTIGQP
ncbi:hypothetical protein Lal_00030058 [Lupinus albus]|nr:hypothetical protein Lal_00030058 [Lupinus albus]